SAYRAPAVVYNLNLLALVPHTLEKLGKMGLDGRVSYRCRTRIVVTDHARIIRVKTPSAAGTTNNGVGVKVVADRGRKAVARPRDVVPTFRTAGQKVVDQAGQCG